MAACGQRADATASPRRTMRSPPPARTRPMPRPVLIPLLLLLTSATVAVAQPAIADAPAPDAAPRLPQLTADPLVVHAGEALTLTGRGFPASVGLALLVRVDGRTTRIGGARTGRGGGFLATIRVRPHASADRFVVLACRDACRLQASARFRIAAP
jgi:hypothetical protein